ncbi:NADPH-dependent F420 reductase [Hymenobacter terrenus]|uniref:NADPH-dependent F420 reductase n=1 Tax=Hymenobacter terrenus TaxID=1629124 RepID=UPI00061973AA|nr:NADPH-dependent F420 reductase [Hymenobacter terrenus]
MNISILGTGNWGTVLGKLFTAQGHQVYFGSRTPERKRDWAANIGPNVQVGTYAQAGAFGELVVIATPWPGNATTEALAATGPLPGKILLDATNALQEDYSPRHFEHAASAAEEVARLRPEARVVKAFNTISGFTLSERERLRFGETPITGFYCGDDAAAKQVVHGLVQAAGLAPLDAGPLRNARHLDSMGQLLIALGFGQGLGVDAGFAYLHRPTA